MKGRHDGGNCHESVRDTATLVEAAEGLQRGHRNAEGARQRLIGNHHIGIISVHDLEVFVLRRRRSLHELDVLQLTLKGQTAALRGGLVSTNAQPKSAWTKSR